MRAYAPSPREGPYGPLRIAEDLLDLIDAVSPEPVYVVGHDWGAIGAYVALARRPDRFRAAVTLAVPHPLQIARNLPRHPRQLVRSWYVALFQLPGLAERIASARDFALIDRLWRDWSPGWQPPREHLEAVKACLRASWPAPLGHYRALLRPVPELPRIRVPTLHLMGELDGCIGPELGEGQERFFAGPFESRILPGCGHFLHLERPDAVAAEILGWFERFGQR